MLKYIQLGGWGRQKTSPICRPSAGIMTLISAGYNMEGVRNDNNDGDDDDDDVMYYCLNGEWLPLPATYGFSLDITECGFCDEIKTLI